ncbi:MAG TPA: hypothetical protein VMD30_08170 [Tepidisphaeraceae bacterium]|nr:hypothetical protein [Tepidisphaeraceae bacterium]
MGKLLIIVVGICSMVLISSVTALGIASTGIGGIAKGTRDAIKSAMHKDATVEELQSIARHNGFMLTQH